MALTHWTFDGTSSSPYGNAMQIEEGPNRIPRAVRQTLGGTLHFAYGATALKYDLGCAGIVSNTIYNALRAKLGTTGTLTATQGSCTAKLTECKGVPVAGDPGSSGHMVLVVLGWCKHTEWV